MSPTSCQTAPPRVRAQKYSAASRSGSIRPRLTPLQCLGLRGARSPDEKSVLDLCDDEVENEREHRQHEDACEHGIDVEHALGLVDEVAHASRRAEIFADHRTHEREPDGSVEAREYPTRGRR